MSFNTQNEFTEENKKLMFDTLKFFYSIHNQNTGNMLDSINLGQLRTMT